MLPGKLQQRGRLRRTRRWLAVFLLAVVWLFLFLHDGGRQLDGTFFRTLLVILMLEVVFEGLDVVRDRQQAALEIAGLPPAVAFARLIAEGRKVEAIALLRSQVPLGLKEAHDLVQAVDPAQTEEATELWERIVGAAIARLTTSAEPSAEVRRLVAQGAMLEAIKRYREETGCTLVDAKTRLANLTREQG